MKNILSIFILIFSFSLAQAQYVPPAASGSDARIIGSGTARLTISNTTGAINQDVSTTGSPAFVGQSISGTISTDNMNSVATGNLILNYDTLSIGTGYYQLDNTNGLTLNSGADGYLNGDGVSAYTIQTTNGSFTVDHAGNATFATMYSDGGVIFSNGSGVLTVETLGADSITGDGSAITGILIANTNATQGTGITITSGTISINTATVPQITGTGTIIVTGGTLSAASLVLTGTGTITGAIPDNDCVLFGNPSNLPAGTAVTATVTNSNVVTIRVMGILTGTNTVIVPTGTFHVKTIN